MKRLLALVILPLLASLGWADVKNGDTYKLSGNSWTYEVRVVGTMGDVEVRVSDSSGDSGWVTATPGEKSTGKCPSTSDAPSMTTPGGGKFRVSGGKAQMKNSKGKWVDGGKPKNKKRKNGCGGGETFSDDISSLPRPDPETEVKKGV